MTGNEPSAARHFIAVHGGAWDIPDDAVEPHLRGVERALGAGFYVLEAGGSAIDAVVAAVALLEDDPTFDAGTGSFLNNEGEIELDAAIMDGDGLRAGAVAAVKGLPNPIHAARAVLETSDCVLLVGDGARRFAAEHGVATCLPESLVVPRERERFAAFRADPAKARLAFGGRGDTVGAIAIDGRGGIAAGSSTGGRPFKPPGRVGDTPIVGAGLYADVARGAAIATGHGESVMRTCLTYEAVSAIGVRTADGAAWSAIDGLLARVGGRGGLIVVSRGGDVGIAHSTPRMAHGVRRAGAAPDVRIERLTAR